MIRPEKFYPPHDFAGVRPASFLEVAAATSILNDECFEGQ
jgi:hypothetical protein